MKIGITMGDPSGIGPEIVVKALDRLKCHSKLVVIGDYAVLKKCGLSKSHERIAEIIDLKNVPTRNFRFGKALAEYGKASIEYINTGLDLIGKGIINGLVTAPISKEAVNLSGERAFSGHTGYIARKTNSKNVVMFLANKHLRFGLVTEHQSLRSVSSALSINCICDKTMLVYGNLSRYFGVLRPRIVVCALNPHASDNGLIGNEEARIISVSVAKLKKKFKSVSGPVAADIAISELMRGSYDCAMAIYHDQALIPLKLTGYESGVNVTFGLPFIRTSPLHGVAFDIAGKRKANPASLISAINLADRCLLNRREA